MAPVCCVWLSVWCWDVLGAEGPVLTVLSLLLPVMGTPSLVCSLPNDKLSLNHFMKLYKFLEMEETLGKMQRRRLFSFPLQSQSSQGGRTAVCTPAASGTRGAPPSSLRDAPALVLAQQTPQEPHGNTVGLSLSSALTRGHSPRRLAALKNPDNYSQGNFSPKDVYKGNGELLCFLRIIVQGTV